jgi:hypothetical protein
MWDLARRVAAAFMLGVQGSVAVAGVIYVDAGATGTGDGSTWANAVPSLRTALMLSLPGDELWLAAGTYHAPFTGGIATAFGIQGRSVYGGFLGGETQRGERDWYANTTTLDGQDLQRVVHVSDTASAPGIMDGVTITGGYRGSTDEGGGVFVGVSWDQGVRIVNCLIVGNNAWRGGGLVLSPGGSGSLEIVNCIITGNNAGFGGGAGLYCHDSGLAAPSMIGCIVYANAVPGGADGIFVESPSALTLRNSIIWSPGHMVGSPQDVAFCCVEGGYGLDNISTDPRFVDPKNLDFRLQTGSKCVDAGSNDAVPGGVLLDHAGRRRFLDDPRKANTGQGIAPIVDIGPFELVPDCNQNSIPDDEELAVLDLNGNTVLDVCERTGTTFCFGDDSGAACPCSNQSPPGSEAGCANVSGNGGRLEAFGTASVELDTLILHAEGLPAGAPALYFQGDSLDLVAGPWGAPFGNGLRCAYGAVLRLGGVISSGGQSSLGAHPDSAFRISVQGAIPAGGTRYYQVWYRDGAAFCTGAGFSVTNAVEVSWSL